MTTKSVKLKVNGIHCNGCASKIKNGLDLLEMDHTVDIDVKTGNIKLVFNADKASLSTIKEKIAEVGFQVESVELE